MMTYVGIIKNCDEYVKNKKVWGVTNIYRNYLTTSNLDPAMDQKFSRCNMNVI